MSQLICYNWIYRDGGTQDRSLRYARWTGDDWYIETVDNEGVVGRGACLALDQFDTPHISYIDDTEDTNDDIKYAGWTNDHWTIETIDNSLRQEIAFLELIRAAIRLHRHRGGSLNPSTTWPKTYINSGAIIVFSLSS